MVDGSLKSAICGVGLRSGACEVAPLLLGVRYSPALHLIRFEGPVTERPSAFLAAGRFPLT